MTDCVQTILRHSPVDYSYYITLFSVTIMVSHIIMALLAPAGVHVEVSNTGAVDGDDIALAKTLPLHCVFHCLPAQDIAFAVCVLLPSSRRHRHCLVHSTAFALKTLPLSSVFPLHSNQTQCRCPAAPRRRGGPSLRQPASRVGSGPEDPAGGL